LGPLPHRLFPDLVLRRVIRSGAGRDLVPAKACTLVAAIRIFRDFRNFFETILSTGY
jgi:hypothetical protein